jgi:hypothetical protein
VAKIHYEADGAVSAERFIAALTDFSERRPELWPNLDAKYYELHELGDTWAEVTEGTDLLGGVEAVDFSPGTVIDYHVTSRPDGGCHVAVDFQRIAVSARGRIIGLLVQLMGRRRFAADLRETLDRLARSPS